MRACFNLYSFTCNLTVPTYQLPFRGGWTGSPLRRAGIVAAASVTHVPPSAYVRILWLIQRRRLCYGLVYD
ncbi:hypothetical protein E4U52_003549 [Claviceps spartinae]|nr:hypothetical protein E4U52_003549 [Claviceps spartinae]